MKGSDTSQMKWRMKDMASKEPPSKLKYDAENTKHFGLKLNCKTDADILEAIERHGSVQGFFKAAARVYIQLNNETKDTTNTIEKGKE